jgi:hypothetical protein
MPKLSPKAVVEKERRQDDVINYLKATGQANEALHILGIARSTYDNWRSTDRDFKERSDRALTIGRETRSREGDDRNNTFDPAEGDKAPLPIKEFRWRVIGRPTPKHQEPIVEAWEDKSNLIVLVLGPPSMGKDTIAGDIVLRDSSDRSNRIAWVMESGNFSERRLGRMEGYYWDTRAYDIQPDGPNTQKPTDTMMDLYGKFKWERGLVYPNGDRVGQPKWTRNELFFLGRDNEADPNIWATGIEGAMYGARIDEAILSDIFTQENQISAANRDKQWAWLMGTFLSRLDERGRALFLGTRVGERDNFARLLDEFIVGARVVRQDGHYTKYDNGVATVIIPAIQTDEDGNDVSYWPERFPLESLLVSGNPKRWSESEDVRAVSDLTVEEYDQLSTNGYSRVRGLYEIRDRSPELFATMYQQQPPSSSSGEFHPKLLDHCDDVTRSYGQVKNGSTLVLGIDPARTGGSAWVLWEWDGETISVVDYFYGENIGATGLREKLLVDPITRYWPKYAVYEGNREQSVLEHPQVVDAVKATKTQLSVHMTHAHNRGVGELRVAAMSFDMSAGIIKWPSATLEDRQRTEKIKEHFVNWDAREQVRRVNSQIRQHIPDDIAMAAWVGWVRIKEIAGKGRRKLPQAQVSAVAARRFGQRVAREEPVKPGPIVTDLLSLVRGNDGTA